MFRMFANFTGSVPIEKMFRKQGGLDIMDFVDLGERVPMRIESLRSASIQPRRTAFRSTLNGDTSPPAKGRCTILAGGLARRKLREKQNPKNLTENVHKKRMRNGCWKKEKRS